MGGFILGAVLLPWVDGQFCGRFHGRLVVIRGLHLQGGVDLEVGGGGCICRGTVGRSLSRLKRGVRGRVDAANVAQGGRRAPTLPPGGRLPRLVVRQKVMVVGC